MTAKVCPVSLSIKSIDLTKRSNLFPDAIQLESSAIYVNFALLAEFSDLFKTILETSSPGDIPLSGTLDDWTFILTYCHLGVIKQLPERCDKLILLLDKIMFNKSAIREIIDHMTDEIVDIDYETDWIDVNFEYVEHILPRLYTCIAGRIHINDFVHTVYSIHNPKALADAYKTKLNEFGNLGKLRYTENKYIEDIE